MLFALADPGETTEEDDMPPSRPQTLPRRTPASSNNNRPQVRTTSHQHIPAARDRPWGPPLGSWIADPTKPIAITDRTGTSVVIIPAQRPKNGDKKSAQALSSRISPTNKTHRASLSKSTTSLEGSERDRSEVSSQEYEAPNARMLRSGPNLMMSGLLHGAPGNEYLLTGQVLGPPEAFFPFINFNADGDNDQEDEDDDDGEALLNVHDFIDFGDDSEESEGEKERILSFTGDMSQPASVNSQSPNNDAASHTLLDHLGKGVVTAFRRDQHRDKTPPRPFHDNRSKNTDYAFKSGRTDAADTPLSPAKKRKLSNDFNGGSLSPSEPNLKKRALSSHTDTQNLMTC